MGEGGCKASIAASGRGTSRGNDGGAVLGRTPFFFFPFFSPFFPPGLVPFFGPWLASAFGLPREAVATARRLALLEG